MAVLQPRCRCALRLPRNDAVLTVDTVGLGLHDYLDVIKRPMDLGTVARNLDERLYNSADEFAADVRLIFSNCCKYNPPEHDVVAMARRLQEVFEFQFSRLPPDVEPSLAAAFAESPSPPPTHKAHHIGRGRPSLHRAPSEASYYTPASSSMFANQPCRCGWHNISARSPSTPAGADPARDQQLALLTEQVRLMQQTIAALSARSSQLLARACRIFAQRSSPSNSSTTIRQCPPRQPQLHPSTRRRVPARYQQWRQRRHLPGRHRSARAIRLCSARAATPACRASRTTTTSTTTMTTTRTMCRRM